MEKTNIYGHICPIDYDEWPVWANFLTIDRNGEVLFSEKIPVYLEGYWICSDGKTMVVKGNKVHKTNFNQLIWEKMKEQEQATQPQPQKNDCYTCKHRKSILGSAHSACSVFGDVNPLMIELLYLAGKSIRIRNGDDVLLEVDEYGARMGWAAWPINFDPTWITCRLPLLEDDTQPE